MQQISWTKILDQLSYNSKDPLLFNSGFFLFFILLFLFFYQFLYKNKTGRVLYFTFFSLYFFYKACGWYVGLILLSAIVDFNLSIWIYKTRDALKRKGLLILSIVINLGLLFYFKYTNFFIQILNDLQIGQVKPLHILLPIGISFYTFENLSYTIDVYRKCFKPVKSFLDYCFFLSFFPKLVMGPIVRASDFIPQIRQDIYISKEDIGKGLFLILGGLFKKVVISDYIYVNFVQYIFDAPEMRSGIECLFGVYGYALVIYCDFSGYSDMAIGMAKWMGFTIPENFRTPYRSQNITEFWRRWHISLSSWLKDYLYISLGGNRKGKWKTYRNLFLTMLLGGWWHGPSWNFIIWGALHGIALAIDKAIKSVITFPNTILNRIIGILLTFHIVCFCWIFFKADTLEKAIIIIKQIGTNLSLNKLIPLLQAYPSVFAVMALGYAIHFVPDKYDIKLTQHLTRTPLWARVALIVVFIWVIVQVKTSEQVMPIYLQF